jgi:hypothetical protein
MNISISIPCKTMEGQRQVANALREHCCYAQTLTDGKGKIWQSRKVIIKEVNDGSGREVERWTNYYVEITVL